MSQIYQGLRGFEARAAHRKSKHRQDFHPHEDSKTFKAGLQRDVCNL